MLSRESLERFLGFALSAEQWSCVSAPMGPLVIVAGAGTGKTTVMAARVLWLVASGCVGESQVLGLTFTNKAASELGQRVETLLRRWRESENVASAQAQPTISTYHAFAGRLIQEQGLRLGVEPRARLLSAAAVAQLVHREVCQAPRLDHWTGEPAALTAAVMRLDANLAEQAITTGQLREHDRAIVAEIDSLDRPPLPVQRMRETALRRMELSVLVERSRAARAAASGLDFSDQMRLGVELVQASEAVVGLLRARHSLVLLDEYQDTSIAQRTLLATAFSGMSVTAVGDPLQAIYGWRSASVANIAAFGEHFAVPPAAHTAVPGAAAVAPQAARSGASLRVLSRNRRSAAEILTAANRVAIGLRAAHPEVAPLAAERDILGSIRAALLPNVNDERRWLCDRIAELLGSGIPADSIAVLARTNDDLLPLAAGLRQRGVPTAVSGKADLADSPFVAEVLATMRTLWDPADNASAVALLAGPRWRLGTADLAALGNRAKWLAGATRADPSPPDEGSGGSRDRKLGPAVELHRAVAVPEPSQRPSVLAAAADPGPMVSLVARMRLRQFTSQMRDLAAHLQQPLADLTERIIEASGAAVEAELACGPHGDAGLEGLRELVTEFSAPDGRWGVPAFLAYMELAEGIAPEQVERPARPGSVQLMTVHQAKGLEFPVVVLPHLSQGVFPSARPSPRWTARPDVVPGELRDDRHVLPSLAGLGSAQLKEFAAECREHDRSGEDRLAYVAITRARDVVIASGHWRGPTQKGLRGPSDYLQALREVADDPDLDPWTPRPDVEAQIEGGPGGGAAAEVAWPAPDRDVVELARRVRRGPAPAANGLHGPAPEPAALLPASGDAADVIAQWDSTIAALSAQRAPSGSPPDSPVLTTTELVELLRDPAAFELDRRRPMPRPNSHRADLGTAFHEWVQARMGTRLLLIEGDLPGHELPAGGLSEELEELCRAFERLPHAGLTPAGLEVPFSLALGGRVIRGRLDAVFPAGGRLGPGVHWDVVDWKTSEGTAADPLQLAVYRIAWARLRGVPTSTVSASFVHIRSGRVVRPDRLAEADELGQLLAVQADVVDLRASNGSRVADLGGSTLTTPAAGPPVPGTPQGERDGH